MYCSSCGASAAQGLSYCKNCGAKLSGERGDAVAKSSGVKPELLVSAMVGGLIFGLVAIAVLIGVLKTAAGLDLPFLLAALMFSFLMLLTVEGVLIWLLLSGRRRSERAGGTGRLGEQKAEGLGEARARELPEPLPSVTEHTTRLFEPARGERR